MNIFQPKQKPTAAKPSAEFPLLSAEVVSAFRSLTDDPEIVAASRLVEDLKAAQRTVMDRLRHCSTDGPAGPAIRYDASADAEGLLGGALPESLAAPAEESARFSLLRQLRALERAVPAAENRRTETAIRRAVEETERLRPIIAPIVGGLLHAFECLLVELQRWAQIQECLGRHGIYHSARTLWDLTSMESQLLHGGAGYPALRWYIDQRREALGLKDEVAR